MGASEDWPNRRTSRTVIVGMTRPLDPVAERSAWTADGRIRYIELRHDVDQYWTMDADGRHATQLVLPAIIAEGTQQAWQPALP
jgi:hypothetical protein